MPLALIAISAGSATAAVAPPWSVIGTAPIGGEARQIAVAADGSHLYVGNSAGDAIKILDPLTGVVTGTLPLPAGSQPSGLGISPSGDALYVGVLNDGSGPLDGVITVNPVTGAVTHPSPFSKSLRPWVINVTPSGAAVFGTSGADPLSDGFNVLSTSTWNVDAVTMVASPPNLLMPQSGVLTPDGAYFYVAACNPTIVGCGTDGLAFVYRTSDNSLVTTVSGLGGGPEGVAANPVLPEVYVRNLPDNTISVINTDSNTVVGTISGIGPGSSRSYISLAVNPSGTYLVSANRGNNTVSVIDLKTRTIERTLTVADGLPAGNGAFSVAFNPSGTRLYIGNRGDHSVTTLAVPAPPNAPVSPSVTAGVDSLSVSYGTPDDNGSPITDYEYSLDGGTTWVSAKTTATSFTISALKPGTTYAVKVRAVNAIGAGQVSAAVTSTTTAASADPAKQEQAAEASPKITMPAASVTQGATLTTMVSPSVAGTVKVTATMAGRTVCTATKKAKKAGRMTVTCALSPAAKAAIRIKPVTLTVTARLTDAKGKTASAKRTVKVARYRVTTPVTG